MELSVYLEIIIVVLIALIGYFGGKSEKARAILTAIAFWLGYSENLINTLEVSLVDFEATMDDFGDLIKTLKNAFEDGKLTIEEVNKIYEKYKEARHSYNILKEDYRELEEKIREAIAKIKK